MEDRDDNKNNVIKKLPKSGFKRKSFVYLLILYLFVWLCQA